MLLTISGILDEAALLEAQELCQTLTWRDGSQTAGSVAGAVKNNLQADLASRSGTKLRDIIETAVRGHSVLQAAAQPRRFSKLIISKTGPGGGYGLHIDNAHMGAGDDRLRTDLSFTLFLSEPGAVDGGELSIEHAGFTQNLKLPAGDLVLYPSTSLHQVLPVTRGDRLVCVGWIESAVKNASDRELLFDLENLRADLSRKYDPQSAEMLTLAKTIANLKRRFD